MLGLAVVLSAIQMQSQNAAPVEISPITSTGTRFETPVTDPKWSNSNGHDYTKASYREYTGESSITLTSPTAVDAQITVDADVAKGILKVAMEGGGEIVYRQVFTADGKQTFRAQLKPGVTYVVKFIGIRTKGSYFCQWTPVNNQTISTQ